MQRIELQPAYILHQRAYSDTSAIVDLITPEFGRISVLAKGAKRPKSRFQGLLRAFQPMLVSCAGRGELMTLTQVEIPGQHLQMLASYLSSGFYLNELMVRLLQKFEPQIELFNDYDKSIRRLCDLSDEHVQRQWLLHAILRIFEIKLLRSLGYETEFNQEADSGNMILPDLEYRYHIEYGPVKLNRQKEQKTALEGQSDVDLGNISQEQGMIVSGKTLLIMSSPEELLETHDQTIFREAKRLMRIILANRLGDKPLHSRELFLSKS